MIDVTVVLVNDGYASTAIAPLEVFSSAGVLLNAFAGEAPEPRFRVQVASVDGRPVQSAHQLAVSPQTSIAEIEKTDLIVVSAIGLDVEAALAAHRPLLDWLRLWSDRGTGVAAACAGVSFLAEAGLLDGRRATTHWALARSSRGAIRRWTGIRRPSSRRTKASIAGAGSMASSTSASISWRSSAAMPWRWIARARCWWRCRALTKQASPFCP
ncbi:DJ-1/PfpI family protein [Fodinicurvata halophila]|uniref:DJ-1/PfpI family protein n=1 Tax=Fodinicurvata halophila TaxID=1419723 RepID=UPI00364144FC